MYIKNLVRQTIILIFFFGSLSLQAKSFNDIFFVNTNKNFYGQNAQNNLINIPQNSKILSSNFSNKNKNTFIDYYAKYFMPWNEQIKTQAFESKVLQSLLSSHPKRYMENYQIISGSLYADIEDNINLKQINALLQKAIVIKNTNLRVLPVNSPLFDDPNSPGEGYPFDYLQDDFLKIGEPLLISHYTKDGKFVYAKTSSGENGFILAEDLVTVDNLFINNYQKQLIMLAKDTLGQLTEHSPATIQLYMGSVLPQLKNDIILLPIRNRYGKAELQPIKIATADLLKQPLAFSEVNVKKIVDQFLGQPYGWGGNLFHRDCARLVRDYFAVFGIYFPLLSKEQANQGEIINLAGLTDIEKKNIILQQAIPYQSIIALPGHIGIYMGKYNDEPIMLQSCWAIKLFDKDDEYRYVIGKIILSTMNIGQELPGFVPAKSSILTRTTHIANQII